MGYDPKNLTLMSQSVAGVKDWAYKDTGGEVSATYVGAGYFTDAKNRGVDTGDTITIYNQAASKVRRGAFSVVQDTGSSSGTVVLDTG
jgi:hypothetical protein